MTKPTFIYVSFIKTTPEKLWQALTSDDFTKQYWMGYSIKSDWKVGSNVKFFTPDGVLAHFDKVLKADKPTFLSYTWTPQHMKEMVGEKSSKVSFELEQQGDLVKLTVTHYDFPENSKVFPMINKGWPMVLSSLKSFLETNKALQYSPAETCCSK